MSGEAVERIQPPWIRHHDGALRRYEAVTWERHPGFSRQQLQQHGDALARIAGRQSPAQSIEWSADDSHRIPSVQLLIEAHLTLVTGKVAQPFDETFRQGRRAA